MYKKILQISHLQLLGLVIGLTPVSASSLHLDLKSDEVNCQSTLAARSEIPLPTNPQLENEEFRRAVADAREACISLKKRLRILETINEQESSTESSERFSLTQTFSSLNPWKGRKEATGETSWSKRQIKALRLIEESIQSIETQQKYFMNLGHNLTLIELPDTRGWETLPRESLKQTLVSVRSNAEQSIESLLAVEERMRSLK